MVKPSQDNFNFAVADYGSNQAEWSRGLYVASPVKDVAALGYRQQSQVFPPLIESAYLARGQVLPILSPDQVSGFP